MKSNSALTALFIGALSFSGINAVNAEESTGEAVDHKAQAVTHLQQAIEHGKQGHADVLVEHAKAAKAEAEEQLGVKTSFEVEGSLKPIQEAIEHGQQGHADVATAAAEKALAVLTSAPPASDAP